MSARTSVPIHDSGGITVSIVGNPDIVMFRNTKAGFNLTGGEPSSLNVLIRHEIIYQVVGETASVPGWQIEPLGDNSVRVCPAG